MSNAITAGPNPTPQFGYGFNYNLWTAATTISITNVPWNNDYRDICEFPTPLGLSLDQYIDSNEVANIDFPNVSYIKIDRNQVILNTPYNKAMRFNYMRVSNPVQPIPGGDFAKSYYYFINNIRELGPNATLFTLQLDVWNSFYGEFSFGQCFVERGHLGIANTNAFDNFGRDYLTVPEGLNVGGEYQIISRAKEEIIHVSQKHFSDPLATINGNALPPAHGTTIDSPSVLVISTTDLTADPGAAPTLANPDNVPNLVTAKGMIVEGLPSGADMWVFDDLVDFNDWMQNNQDTPWVTQGVTSVTLIPAIARYDPTFWSRASTEPFNDLISNGHGAGYDNFINAPRITALKPNWRQADDIINAIPERYRGLLKLFTYPYMTIELTTWSGKALSIKPESWNDPDATVVEKATFIAPNARIVFVPRRYNAVAGSTLDNSSSDIPQHPEYVVPDGWTDSGDDGGEYLDFTTMIDNFPTFPLVNNGQLGYLASNFASLSYQGLQAEWTQAKALRGNQVSYDQNNRGIQTTQNSNALTRAGNQSAAASQNLQLTQAQAAAGAGGDIIALGQAATGATNGSIGLSGVVGAVGNQVMGAIQTGIQTDTNNRNAGIANSVNLGQTNAATGQSAYVNDTNKGLADWAANGDYSTAIAGINAQVQGASMIQPTMSGQQGGDTFNLSQQNMEINLRFKMIDPNSLRIVGDYFLRYGYSIGRFIQFPGYMVMSKFTYWKLQETYINSASIPEGFKQIIRGIFEKGVTVWADPNYIGNTDLADNQPKEGVAY